MLIPTLELYFKVCFRERERCAHLETSRTRIETQVGEHWYPGT